MASRCRPAISRNAPTVRAMQRRAGPIRRTDMVPVIGRKRVHLHVLPHAAASGRRSPVTMRTCPAAETGHVYERRRELSRADPLKLRSRHAATFSNGETRTRTGDTTIFSRVLYQ